MELEREFIVCSCNGNGIKGPWSTLVESAPQGHAAYYFMLWQTAQTNSVDVFLDIAVGPVAAEEIIIENLPVRVTRKKEGGFHIPILIPEGQRVSLRGQAVSPIPVDIYVSLVSDDDGPLFLYE